jgi:hypothetical protein
MGMLNIHWLLLRNYLFQVVTLNQRRLFYFNFYLFFLKLIRIVFIFKCTCWRYSVVTSQSACNAGSTSDPVAVYAEVTNLCVSDTSYIKGVPVYSSSYYSCTCKFIRLCGINLQFNLYNFSYFFVFL